MSCKQEPYCKLRIDPDEAKPKSGTSDLLCTWIRAFDGHFNISCPSGERANGNFRGKDKGAKWEFIYCPYCGGKIIEKDEEYHPNLDGPAEPVGLGMKDA